MENEVIITLSKSDFLRLKRTLFKMLKDEFLQCMNSIIEEAVYHVLGKYYNLKTFINIRDINLKLILVDNQNES